MKHFAGHAFLKRWAISNVAWLLVFSCFSQEIAVGTWRTHFNHSNAQLLEVTADKIFCASENGLFSREISSGVTRKLSKIDGLSSSGVSAMAYDASSNVLVIGYRSGFIDFVFEDEIITRSDLADSELDIERSINAIAFNGDRTYIATDIGIIVFETEEAEVLENFVNIGLEGAEVAVNQLLFRNDSIVIRTSEGIQSGSLSQNLLDFTNWNYYAGSGSYLNLTSSSTAVFATEGSNLLQLGLAWSDTGIDLPDGAELLFDVEGEMYTAEAGTLFRFVGTAFEETFSTGSQINDVVAADGAIYLADGELGLINEAGDRLSPDGPVSDEFSNFKVISNELFGFHAPNPSTFNGAVQQASFSVFTEGRWEERSIDNFTNVSDVARFNSQYYFSSIGDGLFDETADEIVTDIPGSSSDLDTVVTALASGEQLWVSSFDSIDPIHLLDSDGSWTSISSIVLFGNQFLTIDLSEIGVGWLGSTSGDITVFESGESTVDLISTADGLPTSFVDIDISVEDNAWVATGRGPALFPSASFVFSDSEAILPSFENRTLFEGEAINAVMTDGGNRIWFGTNAGLWVYDENTSEQVAVFNVDNSPLPSDRIIQLAYNGSNGEVFIYTDQGMVSYRSSSSRGSIRHRNVNVFPNPVRPSYQGLVGLTGLARNGNVKVTDINGNLVAEVDANGGTASWNLRDLNGSQVATGIYLFFSSSSDGEETYVGKIAVVR